MIHVKRVYESASSEDGYRVLVDRLWPRGVSKERAALDEWLKDVAPSDKLRTWYGHDPKRFDQFKKKYIHELDQNPATKQLFDLVKAHSTLTLLYGAKSPLNQAAVLKEYLEKK